MNKHSDFDDRRLQHIAIEISICEDIVADGKETFYENSHHGRLRRHAADRALQIIQQAAQALSDDYRARHPQLPWNAIRGMRNRLVHEYHGVDVDLVWWTLAEQLPVFKRRLDLPDIDAGDDYF